ncbi:MAG: C_GCAxxG_C_C family protein [Lachnospiraceae bacterium]|nr:C_GCAxxG_C_C family protein [Lachnospiraceae bacterium]
MESRIKQAVALFEAGHGCAQAVFATYADLFGVDRTLALKLASPLGGGMGRMREVCGAVSAMALLAGLKDGNTDPSDEEGRERIYLLVRQMSDAFRKENGSMICRELLGLQEREEDARPDKRTEEYYAKRPCSKLVASAAEIIEKNLFCTDKQNQK